MIRQEGQYAHRVDRIHVLIPEEFCERRRYEYVTLPESQQSLGGQVIIQKEKLAKAEAELDREGLVLWTDGSRKEDEWVGCAVMWKEERWEKRREHLSRQKEAFDAEIHAISEAVRIAQEKCTKKTLRWLGSLQIRKHH